MNPHNIKIYKISKQVIDTIYKISNVYIEKGLEVKGFELRTKDVFMTFFSPYNVGSCQDIDLIENIQTNYCGICDRFEIECCYKIGRNKDQNIIQLVDRINSVIDVGNFKINRSKKIYYLRYLIHIKDISQCMDLLDNVLTNYLNNLKKYDPLIIRQLTSDESPSTIWEDFEKSSPTTNTDVISNGISEERVGFRFRY